jgi:DNA polymerase-3 subunit delta
MGVIVLDVKSWKSNTRLAKVIPDQATIKCEALPVRSLASWCSRWAKARHGKQLTPDAASLLVELIGPEMGILDQELAKLAIYVGDLPAIGPADVDRLVGHSRVETAWQMLDAVAAGNAAQALRILQHLFDQGEEPIALLGAMSWQLRRIAQAARLQQQGTALSAALSRAGLPPFKLNQVEQQLRHLGPRAFQLYDWLREVDLGLKSSGQLPAQVLLERLLIKLAARPSP